MFDLKRIGFVVLVLTAFSAKEVAANFRNAVQPLEPSQCRLERSAHLYYHCDIPATDLKPGETILRSESFQRVQYPCEVRVQSYSSGFRISVTKLSDPKFLGFNQSEAERCLQKVAGDGDSALRFQILEYIAPN